MQIGQSIPSMTSFQQQVYILCSKVPKGKVTTYNAIAQRLHSSPRAVGNALRCNPFAPHVPCHRVIKNDGHLGGFAGKMNNPKKRELLTSEGVSIIGHKVEETCILRKI